jgi:hypothetical protein
VLALNISRRTGKCAEADDIMLWLSPVALPADVCGRIPGRPAGNTPADTAPEVAPPEVCGRTPGKTPAEVCGLPPWRPLLLFIRARRRSVKFPTEVLGPPEACMLDVYWGQEVLGLILFGAIR